MIALSPTLSLPNDAVTQTFAFVARRGAGKSYGAMKLAEEMLAIGAQVVAIDPVGVWYSLRIAADGKGKGFDLPIFGGLHGDVPLEPGAGAFIADLLVDRGISAVLDVSQMRKHDRKVFATYFAEQLFHRKKQRRSPLHLFVEEAQVFVPQNVSGAGRSMERGPDGKPVSEARLLGAFEDIVKLGRNFGIGATLVSQRPQSVNKDALNQTEALFVLQTNGAQERKALENWIIEQGIPTKSLADELPSLPVGTAYLWSPSWLRKLEKIKIGRRKTYDASATPVAGVEAVEPRPLSASDFAEIEKAMATTIERAKAEDPKALRARIVELERALKSGGDPAEIRALQTRIAELEARPPERVEVPVVSPEDRRLFRDDAVKLREAAITLIDTAERILGEIARVEAPVVRPAVPAAPQRAEAARPVRTPVARAERPQRPPTVSDDALGGGPLKMLEALAGTRDHRATRVQLGMLAGYSAKGGTYAKYLSDLRTRGLVEGDGSTIVLTDSGRARVGHVERSITTAEVHAMWRRKLGSGPRRMLDALIEVWPHGLSREDLGSATGFEPSGGTFAKYLSTLSSNDLIEKRGSTIVASEALFPTGAPR